MLSPWRTKTRPDESVIQRPACPGVAAWAEHANARTTATQLATGNWELRRTRFTNEQLNDDRVPPFPPQPRMPPVHPHVPKPERPAQRKARLVLRKDAAEQLPVTARLAFGHERLHRRTARTLSPRLARDVHGEVGHPGVGGPARPVGRRGRPGNDLTRPVLHDHERKAALYPGLDVRCAAGLGLERGEPVLDSLVVDARDGAGVARAGEPNAEFAHYAQLSPPGRRGDG